MFEWMVFALIGVLSGLSAGLLGLGGGLIIVPSLLFVFNWQGTAIADVMHLAIGTSLMTITVTSLASSYSHYRHGHVDWSVVKKIIPGLIIGAILGVAFGVQLSSHFLQNIFALYLLIAAINIWLPSPSFIHQQLLKKSALISFGGVAGGISSLVGIGGGTFIVPYLVMAKQPVSRAIGVAAVCGVPISIAAVASFFVFNAINSSVGAEEKVEFIYWKAFWGIISTSILFSIIGARLAKNLPVKIVKKIFSLALVLVGIVLLN